MLLVAAAEGRLKSGCAVGVITFYKAQVTFPSPFSFLFNFCSTRLCLSACSSIQEHLVPGSAN